MKNVKRILCIIMAAVIFVTAPVTSCMEAQAVEVTVLPLVEDLLLSLGITFGLGEQSDFFSDARQQALDDFMSAAASGGTITLPEFGIVDFSSSTSIMSFLDYSLRCNMLLLGDPVDLPQSTYSDMALALDQISYHNSGTSATNAMNDSIEEFYNDYNGSSEALAEDVQSCFSVINGGGDFNDDDDDDKEKAARRRKFWKTFLAVTSAGMIGFGNTALPLAALKEYGNSEFSEYDAVFGEAGFDGSYKTNADGNFVYSISGEDGSWRFVFDKVSADFKIAGVVNSEQNRVYFYRLGYNGSVPVLSIAGLRISQQISLSNGMVYENGKSYSYCGRNNYSGNIPLYSTMEAALNALLADIFSDAENIQSSYADFKKNTGSARAVVGNPFANYVASLDSLADLAEIIPGIKKASDTYGGTAEMLPEIAKILSEAGDAAISKPGVDDPDDSSSGNYSGILGKILTAIKGLPASILNAFTGKFMTASGLKQLINNLPQLFVQPFTGMLNLVLKPVIDAIKDQPQLFVSPFTGMLNLVLKPVIDAINLIPGSLELGNIITKAAEDAGTELFVPEEGPALQKIDDMKEYFKFKDDMEVIIYEFKKNIFGVKPSPVLKIPIGKPTSKKYNYGTGDYIIIDVSWYAKYKDFGDKIILAFAWACFIWRMFVYLPGIISGGVGGIQSIGDAYTVYKKNGSGD